MAESFYTDSCERKIYIVDPNQLKENGSIDKNPVKCIQQSEASGSGKASKQ